MKKIFGLLAVILFLTASCKDLINIGPKSATLFDFIRENPDKASLIMTANDTVWVNISADKKTRLGSVVNLITVLEYAQQVQTSTIHELDTVSITEIERYNLGQKFDPGYFLWRKSLEDEGLIIGENSVHLKELARGLVRYESMAVGEYLSDRIGINNINVMTKQMGMSSHDFIYPYPVSTFLLFSNIEGLPADEFYAKTRNSILPDYPELCKKMHASLKKEPIDELKTRYRNFNGEIDVPSMEKAQPSATALEYHKLLKAMNQRAKSPDVMQSRFGTAVEWKVQDYRYYYSNLGFDIGNTSSDITGVMYTTSNPYKNRTEVVCFLHDLTPEQKIEFQSIMFDFMLGFSDRRNLKGILTSLGI